MVTKGTVARWQYRVHEDAPQVACSPIYPRSLISLSNISNIPRYAYGRTHM